MDLEMPRNRSLRSKRGERTWEIARYLPYQGQWSVRRYFGFIDKFGIEYNKGVLEFLPWPDERHRTVLHFLLSALHAFVKPGKLGRVTHRLRLKVATRKFREPDLLFISNKHPEWFGNKFWRGCDIVGEVVSPGYRKLDLVRKRKEYALAGIAEYWILDLKMECIVVLRLNGKEYIEHGVFKKGDRATSLVLNGFSVDVTALLTAD